jgi:hypothetical protein
MLSRCSNLKIAPWYDQNCFTMLLTSWKLKSPNYSEPTQKVGSCYRGIKELNFHVFEQ